jgi:hypothetical protein
MKTISVRALQASPIAHLEQLKIIYGIAMRGLRAGKPAHSRLAAVNLLRVSCEIERRGAK